MNVWSEICVMSAPVVKLNAFSWGLVVSLAVYAVKHGWASTGGVSWLSWMFVAIALVPWLVPCCCDHPRPNTTGGDEPRTAPRRELVHAFPVGALDASRRSGLVRNLVWRPAAAVDLLPALTRQPTR
jgi:hypothetical protein